jgi:hypothetical protein
LFVFDREVVPAGADVFGHVSRLESLTKCQRARSILGGDFTPLHRAYVEFTTLTMPDGSQVGLHTFATVGLKSIYSPAPLKKKRRKAQSSSQDQSAAGGVLGVGKQTIQDKINAEIYTRTKGIAEIVRGPNKKERLVDLAMATLPYHPQWVRRGTRFDAELIAPVQFGSQPVVKSAFELLGSQASSRQRGARAFDHTFGFWTNEEGSSRRGDGGRAAVFTRTQARATGRHATGWSGDGREEGALVPSRRTASLQFPEDRIAGASRTAERRETRGPANENPRNAGGSRRGRQSIYQGGFRGRCPCDGAEVAPACAINLRVDCQQVNG